MSGRRTSVLPEAFDENEPYTSGERRLMMAVIFTALNDAIGNPQGCTHPDEREAAILRARNWFERNSLDFRNVCQMAGLESEVVRAGALAFIQSGQPMPRINRSNRPRVTRNPLSHGAIAAEAGVSPGAVGDFLKHGKGSADLKARVRRAIRDITEQQLEPA